MRPKGEEAEYQDGMTWEKEECVSLHRIAVGLFMAIMKAGAFEEVIGASQYFESCAHFGNRNTSTIENQCWRSVG